ncbi:hypothetical protein B7494_g6953 [Chlorociboria aeruginascens]|nr:hypothetical protein B7494_g6953 [Chlorociboria aeruginascens]
MSADFWAGYISGAIGILIGNPLDLIKVRLQYSSPSSPTPYTRQFTSAGALIRGSTAPILGYGALNALLFVTYNRTSDFLNQREGLGDLHKSLWKIWLAGAVGGLATWAVSTPTELIKCRAQLSSPPRTSWAITKEVFRKEGVRGFYYGGVVTALRDAVGYGFYFWSYELSSRFMSKRMKGKEDGMAGDAARVLLCGGLAGVVTWLSIFPLDVVKTRVQGQVLGGENRALLGSVDGDRGRQKRLGAMEIARNAYKTEGGSVFFRGLMICSVRAFIVNAAQWAVYEWIMKELRPANGKQLQRDATINTP